MSNSQETLNPFWNFSSGLYANPLVKTACLVLQDQYKLNVNLLLFCLWCGTLQHLLTPVELEQSIAKIAAWQRIATQIRLYRKQMQHNKLLYQALLQTELIAEYQQQTTLVETLVFTENCQQSSSKTAYDNLICYLATQSIDLNASIRAYLQTLAHML